MSDPKGNTKVPDLDRGTDPESVVFRALLSIDRHRYGRPIEGWLEYLISYRGSPHSPFGARQGARYETLNAIADTAGLEGAERKKLRHSFKKAAVELGLTEPMSHWIKKNVEAGKPPRPLPDSEA